MFIQRNNKGTKERKNRRWKLLNVTDSITKKGKHLGTGSMAELIDPNGVEEIIIGRYDAQTKHWYHYPEGGVIV